MKATKQLPARAELAQLRKQAKDLLSSFRAGDAEAVARVVAHHPRHRRKPTVPHLRLTDAQLVVAREYGFATWNELKRRVEAIDLTDPVTAFIEAGCVPLDGTEHGAGNLTRAEALRAQHPGRIGHDMFTAAILGDDVRIAQRLKEAPASATEPGGLYDWDPLTYLCFSRYLKQDPQRSTGFVRAARLLLAHGASANTGFYWQKHDPEPALETAIYGAAGVAQHPELTALLLEHGADPNDGETAYHVAEGWDSAALKVLVRSGKLAPEGVTTLLLRKLDWHDFDAVKWLLEHGADPNCISPWGRAALHHALGRGNGIGYFELLLDHGADPSRESNEAESPYFKANGLGKVPAPPRRSAFTLAARAGRGDVLQLFRQRAPGSELAPLDELLAACACDDAAGVAALAARAPDTVRELVGQGASLLAAFADNGNARGVAHLLDLGVDVAATRGYDALPAYVQGSRGRRAWRMDRPLCLNDTALHIAAWRGHHETVELLIERGAPVDLLDGNGQTPLALAVRACVESYWTARRAPDSVRSLLAAGASASSVDRFPSGYDEVDELLRARGASPSG